ncbi:putative transcriptional regulator [Duganella sp. 3397]|uniref:YqgE/AlgH family protein n=1 Tax=Duganella sp. 3397 TaxID=2817732 RepID=UPI002854B53B|nr:YqgE/AlgH family protein [Duganella sp. 3397]MDR7050409.1 putative transcriptional regulator [Duganella sp. 3397]
MKKSKIGKTLPVPGLLQEDPLAPAGSAATEGDSPVPQLNLANHFLIAMPSMQDPVFGGTVVYVCEHNENGVLGVVINKPTDMTMQVLFERIDLTLEGDQDSAVDQPVMFGGPVQDDRGFVLHTPGQRYSSSLTVTEEVAFTTSIDVLEAVASGDGPPRMLVSIGYSGWSPGQLEDEIGRNGWLTVGADPEILFGVPIEQRYTAAIRLLGIDPLMLASEAGHA